MVNNASKYSSDFGNIVRIFYKARKGCWKLSRVFATDYYTPKTSMEHLLFFRYQLWSMRTHYRPKFPLIPCNLRERIAICVWSLLARMSVKLLRHRTTIHIYYCLLRCLRVSLVFMSIYMADGLTMTMERYGCMGVWEILCKYNPVVRFGWWANRPQTRPRVGEMWILPQRVHDAKFWDNLCVETSRIAHHRADKCEEHVAKFRIHLGGKVWTVMNYYLHFLFMLYFQLHYIIFCIVRLMIRKVFQ